MTRIRDNRVSANEFRRFNVRFGDGFWSQRRDEMLLRVMRDYGDLDKAARVIGCPRHAVVNRVKFHAHLHPELAAHV
jgi:hypothetical protein